jgi:hypothetical protein
MDLGFGIASKNPRRDGMADLIGTIAFEKRLVDGAWSYFTLLDHMRGAIRAEVGGTQSMRKFMYQSVTEENCAAPED